MPPEIAEIEEEVVEEAVEEVVEIDQETLDIAKSMGWVPEENFRGDKSRWVTAEAFVEKGMNDLPVLRERVRKQASDIASMHRDMTDLKEFHKDNRQREYGRAVKEIEGRQRKTVEEGDTEAYDALQDERRELATDYQPPAQKENPLYTEWKSEQGEWFEKNPEMTDYANSVSDFIAKQEPNLVGKKEFLDKVSSEVRGRFKSYFENVNRDNPSTVEDGGRTHRKTSAKSYANLPDEARAACDRFVRNGQITKEQYVEDYEWGE